MNRVSVSDIAVGAPFDGDGKVFIYRGSDAGIETKPAQVRFFLKRCIYLYCTLMNIFIYKLE